MSQIWYDEEGHPVTIEDDEGNTPSVHERYYETGRWFNEPDPGEDRGEPRTIVDGEVPW